MYLEHLVLRNFRNYSEAEFGFTDTINFIIGDNGAGKTNILEAIYLLSFSKCYTSSTDFNNIKHNTEYFQVQGEYNRDNSREVISCSLRKGQRKSFKLNNKEYDRISDHIGLIPLVIISPYDRDLINEGSDVRRKYVDSVIAQYDKAYLDNLLSYNRALLQRNSLLKLQAEKNSFNRGSFEIWDEQLIRFGQPIHTKRKEFIFRFQDKVTEYYKQLTKKAELIGLSYISQLNDNNFADLLQNSMQDDFNNRFTNCGVHKDDIDFLFNGMMIKKYGSQGQQKSFLIALKLAQHNFIKDIIRFNPILLLDDIFDKLDYERVHNLITLVGDDGFGQVFITDTDRNRVDFIAGNINADLRIIRIDQGNIINDIK